MLNPIKRENKRRKKRLRKVRNLIAKMMKYWNDKFNGLKFKWLTIIKLTTNVDINTIAMIVVLYLY
jgi:uncharacterized protein YbcI